MLPKLDLQFSSSFFAIFDCVYGKSYLCQSITVVDLNHACATFSPPTISVSLCNQYCHWISSHMYKHRLWWPRCIAHTHTRIALILVKRAFQKQSISFTDVSLLFYIYAQSGFSCNVCSSETWAIWCGGASSRSVILYSVSQWTSLVTPLCPGFQSVLCHPNCIWANTLSSASVFIRLLK